MKTAEEELRDYLVSEWSKIDHGFPKTNTKKFKYYQGYSDAIVAIDNYILTKINTANQN